MDASTLRAKLDAEHYIYDDSLITTLLVALQLGRPLLIEGGRRRGQDGDRQGHGRRPGPGAGAAAVLRGPGRGQGIIRVELPEAAAGHPGEPGFEVPGGAHRLPLQRRLPAGAAPAPVHPVGEAGGAAHRRDRQGRRGVRGLPAGAPLGDAGDHPGGGHHPGQDHPLRGADLQPHPAPQRGPPPPLRLPLHPVPQPGEGGGHHPGQAAQCQRASGPPGGPGHPRSAGEPGDSEKALHCRDPGLGGRLWRPWGSAT